MITIPPDIFAPPPQATSFSVPDILVLPFQETSFHNRHHPDRPKSRNLSPRVAANSAFLHILGRVIYPHAYVRPIRPTGPFPPPSSGASLRDIFTILVQFLI